MTMEQVKVCFYMGKEDIVKTIDNCVCGQIHKFHYKKKEFDKTTFNTNNTFKLFRFCNNKPLELLIVKPNKEQKTKIDWNDKDSVRAYKREQKRNYLKNKKEATTPSNSLIDDDEEEVKPKKKIVIILKKKL